MSSNQQKINKMCKNFTKNVNKEAKSLPDLANYEILNTNCTMVGSNNLNLNLDSKLAGYGNNSSSSQVKVCSRPLRSPEVTIGGVAALKKPQSPRGSVGSVSPAPSPQPSPQLLGQAAAAAFLQQQQNLVQIIHSPHAHQVLAPRTIIGTAGQHHHIQPSPPQIKLKPQNILPKPPPVLQSKQPSGHPQQPRCSSTGASGGITTVSQHHVSVSGVSGVPHGVPGVPHGLQGVASGLQSLQGVQGVQGVNVPSMGQLVLPGQVPGTLLLNQVPLLVGSSQLGGGGGVQLILRPGTPGTAGATAGKLPSGPAGTPHLVLQPGTGPQPHQVILQQPNVTNNQRTSQPQQLVRVLTANGMLQSINPLGALNPLTPTYIMQQPVHSLTQTNAAAVQSLTQQQQATVNNTSIPQQQQPQQQPGVNNTVSVTSSNKSVQQVQSMVQTVQAIEQLPPPKKKPKKKKKNKEPKLDLANIMKLSGIGDEDDIMFESDTSESAVSCDTTPTNKIPKSPSPQLQTSQPQEISNNANSLQLANDFTSKRIGNIHISTIPDNISSNNKNVSINRPEGLLNDTRQSQISVQQSLSDINAINQNLAHIGLINQNQNFVNSQQSDSNLAGILQALNGTNNFSLINGQNYHQKNNFPQQKLSNTHFNLQNPLQNIQVQNFSNSNLILNQITPNLSNISSGFSLNNSALTGGTTTTLLQQNFLSAGLVQSPATTQQVPAEVQGVQGGPFSAANVQGMGGVPRTGGFKLALSEDGRLILQHDPTLNQDIQSQLLLQSIFGINLQGGNLVLTSVSNTTPSIQTKTLATVSEPIKKPPPLPPPPPPVHSQPQQSVMDQQTSTKTINMLPNTIPSVKTEPQMNISSDLPQQTPNNYSYIVNLTPDQLELLKRNGQLTVNGQTIFMHKSSNNKDDKNINKSPKGKIKKQPKVENKINKNILQNKIFPPNNKEIKTEPEIFPPNQLNGLEQNSIQVEQFLNNLNINPTNLSQLISQKLSQELPSGVDPKIVNISAGAAGQIVAKIDISSENISSNNMVTSTGGIDSTVGGTSSSSNEPLPPLVSMMKQENLEVFQPNHDVLPPPQPVQIPSSQILSTPSSGGVIGNMLNTPAPGPVINNNHVNISTPTAELPVPVAPVQNVPQIPTGNVSSGQENKVYQRVQTIQLTPQKQQLLKSVQLQIHALSARLQHKDSNGSDCNNTVSLASNNSTSNTGNNSSDQSEIHTALRHLFLEQQKILATGKIIPNITHAVPCTIEALSTQTSTNTSSNTKSNGTFLTSLLQQPAVSHQSHQKVYYHHGNQIIAINPPPPVCSAATTSATTTPAAIPHNTTNTSNVIPVPTPSANLPPCKKPTVPVQVPVVKQEQIPVENKVIKEEKISGPASPEKKLKAIYSKAQLIEQQLQTDQNGAMNPDITTPFSSKADAVKRLVRYHCYKQPVLSQKDLSKADEIFELTARHFIDKFRSMVNKYQVLLLKESMRQVQTSELMMIDRMFLAEEQQSLLKLQSDLKLQNELELNNELSDITPAAPAAALAPAVIKTEVDSSSTGPDHELDDEQDTFDEDNNHDFNIKCGLNYFGGDESCDSGAHFNHQSFDEFIGLPSQQDKTTAHKSNYNTTKIIGNFEIEINNKSCKKNENFSQKDEDYDEWLCIQRELGYFPENKLETDQKHNEATLQNNMSAVNEHNQSKDKLINNKRSSSDRNCLESLKKYRVEKHNSKGKKTGSIIGEVKFEVRIEHKKVFPADQQQQKHQVMKTETTTNECIGGVMTTTTTTTTTKQMPVKRQCFDYSADAYTTHSKRTKPDLMPSFIKQEHDDDDFPDLCVSNDGGGGSETFERSIDEQVQSAIDSILNLQQITSMTEKPALDADGNKAALLQCSKKDDIFTDGPEQTLDEAVKSILS